MSVKFFRDRPWLPWQRNLGQNWLYLGLCERYIQDSCIDQGVVGVGLFNDVSQILPRPTLVAMATKFELKLPITRLICEIPPRFWRLTGGFRGVATERCQSNFSATDPGCDGNKISGKSCYNSACMRDMSKILASTRGFWGLAIERCRANFSATDAGCHGNQI